MKSKSLLAIQLAITLGCVPVLRAEFLSPKDNPPFRRDQLPLDVDTMALLSRQISTIASNIDQANPQNERTVAQCVAISMALDPVNRQAITLGESFEQKKPYTKPEQEHVASSKSNAWRTYAWLSDGKTGKDANLLADCLGDVLAKIDPDHPNAALLKNEKGSWNQWVSPLAEFEAPKKELVANVENPAEVKMEQSKEENQESPKDADGSSKVASFRLDHPKIVSPLWMHHQNTKEGSYIYSLKLAPLELAHEFKEDSDDFRYRMPDHEDERTMGMRDYFVDTMNRYFQDMYGDLPKGGRVSLLFEKGQFYSMRRNQNNLSAAAATLTNASLSGQECTGIVVGVVDKKGMLTAPHNLWELIRFLDSAPPSRIVLPKSAEELLPSLIAMDQLSFFMKHDILLAKDLSELTKFSLKTPDPKLTDAFKQFAEIRAKSTSSIISFVSNPHVLKRLEAISINCPEYASCRYLISASKGQRLSKIGTKVLAHEIQSALVAFEDLEELEEWNLDEINSDEVQAAHEKVRKQLDPFERLLTPEDKLLFDSAIDLTNSARTLARSLKASRTRETETSFHEKSARGAARDLRKELPELQKKIREILGLKKNNISDDNGDNADQ